MLKSGPRDFDVVGGVVEVGGVGEVNGAGVPVRAVEALHGGAAGLARGLCHGVARSCRLEEAARSHRQGGEANKKKS